MGQGAVLDGGSDGGVGGGGGERCHQPQQVGGWSKQEQGEGKPILVSLLSEGPS